ncbi:ATP-binding protein, partial [Bacillus mycoides]
PEYKCLVVDTKQPLESYIRTVMNYIHE